MIKNQIILFLFAIVCNQVKADSPLTSVMPAKAYTDNAVVANELSATEHELSPAECAFLHDPKIGLDLKFAFMNALGWGDSTFVETYTNYLGRLHSISQNSFDSILAWRGNQPQLYVGLSALNGFDYSCLAYLQAMGNYFSPFKAYYCAYIGVDLNPGSEAAAYIYGLIMAQIFFDQDWCKVYESMINIKNFDAYNTERLKSEAIQNIFEYIDLYKEACNNPAENLPKRNEVKKEETGYVKPLVTQKMEDKKNYVDLEVISIEEPEYRSEMRGGIIRVKIRNKGTISNIETNAVLKQLDITLAEAKKRKFKKEQLQIIKEEQELKSDTQNSQSGDIQKWEAVVKIPVLLPNQEVELEFKLTKIWPFDPNCEIEVIIDADKNIEEKNEKNNVGIGLFWG